MFCCNSQLVPTTHEDKKWFYCKALGVQTGLWKFTELDSKETMNCTYFPHPKCQEPYAGGQQKGKNEYY
jgi:hypothetical protein